jgi:hypothetical protein
MTYMASYTTVQIAREIGVHKRTLLRWLSKGLLPEPKRVPIFPEHAHVSRSEKMVVRIWSEADLAKARRFKEAHYCLGRGRKKNVL